MRNKLLERDLLFRKGKIGSSGDHLFIPIKEGSEDSLEDMDYEAVEREVDMREEKSTDYTDKAEVPAEMKDILPSSYDIVGDIALIKLPEELKGYREEIGEAIMEVHPHLKTVLEDKGVHGEFRIREVEHMAGEEETVTTYREHGADFEVDVSEVYFSPRLATERWRVVEKVGEDEVIFDMFAGAGPYTVLIGRNKNVERIHSVDLNPKAVHFLKKNVEKNDLEGVVEVYEADAREVAPKIECDRVIMNLPHTSEEFIASALSAVKESGKSMVHYYEIIDEEEREKSLEELLKKVEKEGFDVRVKEKREVRTYSASKVQMAYDLEVEKTSTPGSA